MKLWLISQTVNRDYDVFDAAVVAAETEEQARVMIPGGRIDNWCAPKHVTVECVGIAVEGTAKGFVLESYNAGW